MVLNETDRKTRDERLSQLVKYCMISGALASLLMNGVTTTDDLTVDRIREALKYGNASGGLCVQKMGGIPALPTKEEIEAFLK